MTRLLLALGVLWGIAGCSGAPSSRPAASSDAPTPVLRATSPETSTPRTPPVRPDPG